jgi:putative ABC transport system permease protein
MSWQNILSNKMRSFLTILGIVIGVTAIIALITIVQGVIDNFNEQFDSVGANTIVVQATGTPLKRGLTDKDLTALNEMDGISGLSPTINTVTDIYREGVIYENIKVDGMNEVYFKRNPDIVTKGRCLNILDVEGKNRVCLINTGLQKKLFMGESALGQSLLIGGISYEIVGITDAGDKLRSVVSMMAGNEDSIILPYKNVMRMQGMNNVMALELYIKNKDNNDTVVDSVKHYLDGAFNYKEDSYMVIEMDSLLDMMKDMQNMMQMMLVGIASIALLVGGIGIMNMMLVSVTERTTEIGLRKALGAEPRRIQIQFLTEAIVLSLLGGFIGILLGAAISFAASLAIGISFALSWFSVALGVAFSGGVGIIFGFAPAKKASDLNPIDALRCV